MQHHSFSSVLGLSAIFAGIALISDAALFDAPVALPGTTYGRAVDVADFDNDGWMDIVVATDGNRADVLYRNNGDGSFTAIPLPGVSTAFGVKCGDIDGDGLVDIVMATALYNPDVIYRNLGGLAFERMDVHSSVKVGATGVDIGDLNDDGLPDIVVSTAGGTLGTPDIVYINNGGMTFTWAALPGQTMADGVAIADVDGDGKRDIVVGLRSMTANTQGDVYRNNGGGVFTAHKTGSVLGVKGVAAGEFNGQAGLEVLAVGPNGGDFMLRSTGSSSAPFSYSPTGVGLGSPIPARYGVATGDLDLDGNDDAFVAVGGADDFVYMNVPSGGQSNFSKLTFPSGTMQSRGVALADFDNDGDLDAVVATASGAADVIYYNTTLDTSNGGGGVPVDTDGDGMPDTYETAHGLNPDLADGDGDLDGDGMSNYMEFIMGTPPNVGSSVGIYLEPGPAGSNTMMFQAKEAVGQGYEGLQRYFTVEYTGYVSGGSWLPLDGFENIVGNGDDVYVPLPANGAECLFYRLKIEVRP